MTPTIEQMMKTYRIIARVERAKTGRPCEETVLNTLRGTRVVCTATGISIYKDADVLTRKVF